MQQRGLSGAELARSYFHQVVGPLLSESLPSVPFSAGRLGSGSDVLGLDDEVSRDHDWGLRLSVFVRPEHIEAVHAVLDLRLPTSFRGRPTRFPFTGEQEARHHIEIMNVEQFAMQCLGFDPRSAPGAADWLSVTGQSVLEITAGPVFVDADGQLTRLREALAWYPDDIWRYVIACDWAKLAQELPLMGRAADVGDEIGARVVGARIAHVIMHLSFLLERVWWPYAKWFGTQWARLPNAGALVPFVSTLLETDSTGARNAAVASALETLLGQQNQLELSAVPRATVPFWDRPYVQPAPEIALQLVHGITDTHIRALPLGLGSVEQRTDNVDILVSPSLRRALARLELQR